MHTASCAALGKLRLKRGKNENEDDEAVSPPKDRPHLAGEKKGFAVCVQIGAQRRESARTSAHCLHSACQPASLSVCHPASGQSIIEKRVEKEKKKSIQ